MADNMKLELVLLGKDFLGKILSKDIGLLKQFSKTGNDSAAAAGKLDAARRKSADAGAAAANAAKKEKDETKKLGTESEKAAAAEEKLNDARRRGKTPDGKIKTEIADKTRLASTTEKAAAAEEKLNAAKKRGNNSGRVRDERGRFVPRGGSSSNSPNRSGRSSQDSFGEDLAQGGTGAGMLWTAKQGLTSAMSKQEALTDLYNSFYRSSLAAADLNAQMREGEKVADALGNKLPGTTADYLQMFATMKQRGIGSKVVVNGAGESAAYLSVANKEDRQETGANMARFGQMFNLQTKAEYMGAADLMSRAKTTYDIGSSELMEAVKDFSGRTGKGLGIDGSKGAEDTLRYLAFLRAKTGMEGLTVGTSASSFFGQYLSAKQKKKDPTEELKKLTGVDLQIFDKKGKFLGLENAVKEFSKLKGKLSDEQSVQFGSAIAGEEGASVFQAMVKNGDQFGAFNQEMTEAASLQDKSAKNAENLTNKIEALTGSLSNLGAEGFKPLISPLSKLTDKTNEWVGSATEAAKANPVTAATISSVLALGGAYLTLKVGSGIASRFLGESRGQIAAVGDAAATATNRVGGLGSRLSGLKSAGKIALTVGSIIGLEYAIELAVNRYTAAMEAKKGKQDAITTGAKTFDNFVNDPNIKDEEKQKIIKGEAATKFAVLNHDNDLLQNLGLNKATGWESYVDSLKGSWLIPGMRTEGYGQKQSIGVMDYLNPITMGSKLMQQQFGTNNSRETAAQKFRDDAPTLKHPEVMREFLKALPERIPGKDAQSANARAEITKTAQTAFPDSFAQAAKELSGLTFAPLTQSFADLHQSVTNLQTPSGELVGQFSHLNTNSGNAVTSVGNLATATNNAASRINNLQITPPTFAPIQIPSFNPAQPVIGPPRARGGSVQPGKIYPVGEIGQEWFSPETSGSIISNDVVRGRAGRTGATSAPISIAGSRRKNTGAYFNINFNPTINVTSDNPNADEIIQQVRRELVILRKEFEENYSPDRMAQQVAFAAQRDAERI